jgi:hypothetical protein
MVCGGDGNDCDAVSIILMHRAHEIERVADFHDS